MFVSEKNPQSIRFITGMSGIIVEFMQDNVPQIAWLMEENSGKMRLMLPNRREMNIATTRLLPWHGPAYKSSKTKDEIISILQQHKDSREEIEKDIDLISLWEMTQGEVEQERADFFAELMQSDTSIDTIVAYAHALLKHKSHFKFLNPLFEVYTEEVVNAKLEAQNQAKEKEALTGIAANWFNYLWELHKAGEIYKEQENNEHDETYIKKPLLNLAKPDMGTFTSEIELRLKNLLLQKIRDPEAPEDDALWKQTSKQLPDDPHLALLLARAWGIVPYHYNFWLDRADFQKNPNFAPWNKEEVTKLIAGFQFVNQNEKTNYLRNYIIDDNMSLENASPASSLHQIDATNIQVSEKQNILNEKDITETQTPVTQTPVNTTIIANKEHEENSKEVKKNTSLNLSALNGLGSFANFNASHKNKQNSHKKDSQRTEKIHVQTNKSIKNEIPQQIIKETTQNQRYESVQSVHTPHENTTITGAQQNLTEEKNTCKILSPLFSKQIFSKQMKDEKNQAIIEFFTPYLDKPFISIDSATTKDIDDAFTLSRTKSGDFEIWIALACPACIWEFNSDFDKQIFQRTSSLYLPEDTYHMMPSELATDLFSLKEKQVRPAFICYVRVSPTGEILEKQFDFMRVQTEDNLHYDACEYILTHKKECAKAEIIKSFSPSQEEEHKDGNELIQANKTIASVERNDKAQNDENMDQNDENMEFLAHIASLEQNINQNTKIQSTSTHLHSLNNKQTSTPDIASSRSLNAQFSSTPEEPCEKALASATKHQQTLEDAYTFAKARLEYRISQGSVIIEKDDMHIRLENADSSTEQSVNLAIDHNTQVFIDEVTQNPCAQLIVSELMILANACLANFATKHNIPLFFRTQDLVLPKEYAGIWRKPEEITKIARSMSGAKTSTTARPHAGLGLQEYSPATSPLRRYGDLVNQAQILRFLYTAYLNTTLAKNILIHDIRNSNEQFKKAKESTIENNIDATNKPTSNIDQSHQSSTNLLWSKPELDALLFNFSLHNEAVTQVQRMRPRYWKFIAIEQKAKRLGERCGFHAIISDENDTYVTITLTLEQLIVRGKRTLFGDKALLGQEVAVRLGKINPLRNEMTILAVEEYI